MSKKIELHHFLNLGFGRNFLALYSDRQIRNYMDITLIFSAKEFHIRSKDSWLTRLRKIVRKKRAYKRLLKKVNQVNIDILFITDVNSEHLIKHIPVGAHAICTGFNQIFSRQLIRKYGSFVNVHPSLLPYYRGPVPSYWCLKYGEKYTGYTLHETTEKIDDGRILYQSVIPIPSSISEHELDNLIAKHALNGIKKYLIHLLSGKILPFKKVDAKEYYINKVGYRSFPLH